MKPGMHLVRTATLAWLLTGLVVSSPLGCGASGDSLVLIGGQKVDSTLIDRDPMALLPSGIVMLGYLDATTMFSSNLGAEVSQIIAALVPLGPEANFVPSRDVAKIYGGLYAMQGADFCAVFQGNFDVEAIRRAADARSMTAVGAPLVKTRYADNDLYTVANLGFVVLTQHTLLAGNEIGMRRALDRLRQGTLERTIPSWMTDLIATPNAAFAVAGDLSAQAAVASASQQLPFLSGLKLVRIIGNFQPPGVNFVGALTYSDPQSAANGAINIRNIEQITKIANLLSSWGFGQGSIPPMQVAQNQNDIAFTMPLSDGIARMLLRQVKDAAQAVARPR